MPIQKKKGNNHKRRGNLKNLCGSAFFFKGKMNLNSHGNLSKMMVKSRGKKNAFYLIRQEERNQNDSHRYYVF